MDSTGTVSIDTVQRMVLDDDSLATKIADMWQQFKYSSGSFRKSVDVDEVKRFLNATSTQDTTNSATEHAHNTHRPKLAQVADTLEAHYMRALIPNEDWMQFTPTEASPDALNQKNRIEEYIRNRHRLYNHRSVINNLVRDWIEDVAICEVVWTSETVRNVIPGMPEKGYIGPKIRRIDSSQLAFDSKARSFHESWKIVQSVKTFGDIATDIENEEFSADYKQVLNKALKYRGYINNYPDVFNSEWQNQSYDGWGTNDYYFNHSNSIELLTFYGTLYDTDKQELQVNQKIVVIDRKWVLLQEDVDTWDGKPHIYMSYWRNRPNSIVGMGPLENLTGMQYMINHLQNGKADALDDVLQSDRLVAGVDDVKFMPDGTKEYWSHEKGADVRKISPDVQILNADFHIETLERKIEEYAGVPRTAAGIKSPGEQTKFEVQTLSDAGSLLFQAKIEKFENEVLERALNAELELARRYLDQNLKILVSQDEGDIFMDINADLMKNKGTLVARGAHHYAQQGKMVQELTQFIQNLSVNPKLALHFPTVRIAEVYNRLLGSFGSKDGLYEKFGQLVEDVEISKMQGAAQREIDNTAIAMETLDNPDPEE